MKIALRISSKKDADGLCELLMTCKPVIKKARRTLRAKTGIFINPAFFDPARDNSIRSMTRMVKKSADVIYHTEKDEAMGKLIKTVLNSFEGIASIDELDSSWLQGVINKHNHPEWFVPKEEKRPETFSGQVEAFIKAHPDFSKMHRQHIESVARAVIRYEGFIRANEDKNFVFDANSVKKETIEDWVDYLRNESALSEEYPDLFKRLTNEYPVSLNSQKNVIQPRGANSLVKYKKNLKSIITWLNGQKLINNHPFDGVTIGSEEYGTPYYINKKELQAIADMEMPTKHLEVQRDIFVFQCSIGCRIGDLYRLTEKNISGGFLEYVPHKTRNKAIAARVPLTKRASELIKKYRGKDAAGRLFPFISEQKYNDALKVILSYCGITRNVTVRNALTGLDELRPISECASSHMARRTFVGNLYFSVQDPNLIGSMSGHVEGSTAFSRYRKIEDQTLRKVIGAMEI